MPRTKVFTPETTEPPDEQAADQNSNGASGWEAAAVSPIGFAPHRGKHRMRDGSCTKCGKTEAELALSSTSLSRTTSRGSGGKALGIDTLITGGFFGLGMLLERRPWMLESLPNPPATPVGRALQLEAAVAGKRIEKALRGTVVYKVVQAFLDKGGPWVEIAPVFAMPLIVGVASMRPDLAEKFRPVMVSAMLPILIDAAKYAEDQARIMQAAEGVTAEMVEAANQLVSSLLATEEKET